jgi:hypothetical protein
VVVKLNYSEEELEFYSNISESTLALLGLQEISYALAKHALEKRKQQAINKLTQNAKTHQLADQQNISNMANSISNVQNAKGFKKKLNAAIDGLGAFTSNTFTINHHAQVERDATKHGNGLFHAAKAGKKAWDLHRAIERKEARSPGWKESTKNAHDYSKPKFAIPKIGEGAKEYSEKMKKGLPVNGSGSTKRQVSEKDVPEFIRKKYDETSKLDKNPAMKSSDEVKKHLFELKKNKEKLPLSDKKILKAKKE